MKKILVLSFLLFTGVLVFASSNNEATASDDKVLTLSMWDIMVSADQEKAVKPAVDKWNAEHPNVQVVRDSLDDDSYKTKIKTAIAAGEAPDIIYTWAGGFSQPFIDAGKILPLDDYVSSNIIDKALPGVLENNRYKGHLYGLPYGSWVGVLYCNQELFDKAGLEIPKTFDDLLSVSKEFKAQGIDAIGVGAAEKWVSMFYHNILAERTAGAELTNKALAGNAPFDSPEFLEAANLLKQLVDIKAFNNGYMGMDYETVENMFVQGNIAMFYQGDWVSQTCEGDGSKVKGKVTVTDFPYVKGHEEYAKDFLGGAADSFMVSADTENKEVAVEFLEYLVEELSTTGAKLGMNLPVYKADIDLSELNPVSQQIAKLAGEATGYTLAWDTFLVGDNTELHLDLVQEIFAGLITPEQFCTEMQTINK